MLVILGRQGDPGVNGRDADHKTGGLRYPLAGLVQNLIKDWVAQTLLVMSASV